MAIVDKRARDETTRRMACAAPAAAGEVLAVGLSFGCAAQLARLVVASRSGARGNTPDCTHCADWGPRGCSERNLLYEARRCDLLTKAAPGRAGGTLTDKARRLLEAPHGQH